jgi:FixJ family two-component response regulator
LSDSPGDVGGGLMQRRVRCDHWVLSVVASRDTALTGRPLTDDPVARGDGPIVFIVEDDISFREALKRLFRTVDLSTEVFGSAAELLQHKLPDVPSCLILDVRLPGVSGLDIQSDLAKANIHIPIIFMTGHGDIPMSVRAMKAGAVDFLTKPFRDQDILDAVVAAIDRDRHRREKEGEVSGLQALFESLSPREREIMALVTTGLMNKQVAAEVGLSEITVKIHRGNVMKKMGAKTLADLVRMAEALHLPRAKQ